MQPDDGPGDDILGMFIEDPRTGVGSWVGGRPAYGTARLGPGFVPGQAQHGQRLGSLPNPLEPGAPMWVHDIKAGHVTRDNEPTHRVYELETDKGTFKVPITHEIDGQEVVRRLKARGLAPQGDKTSFQVRFGGTPQGGGLVVQPGTEAARPAAAGPGPYAGPLSFPELDRLRAEGSGLAGRWDAEEFIRKAPQVADHLLAMYRDNPILHWYHNHQQADMNVGEGYTRNTEGWHVEGERMAMLLAMAYYTSQHTGGSVSGRLEGLHTLEVDPSVAQRGFSTRYGADNWRAAFALRTALLLERATPYLWLNKIDDLVREVPLPGHVVSRKLLPYPVMYWSFETCHQAQVTAEVGDDFDIGDIDWVMLTDEGHGVAVTFTVASRRNPRRLLLTGNYIPYGARWPDDIPEQHRDGTSYILKQLAFLNSPYIGTAPQVRAWPRQLRKALARQPAGAYTPPTTGGVQVIDLRKPIERPTRPQPDAEDEAAARTWHHKWWVSGHIRAQWYPTEQAHRPVWIAPYLKAPGGHNLPVKHVVRRVSH